MDTGSFTNSECTFFWEKNKPTQGYLVFGLLVRGDTLYICPNTNAKKRFSDNQFTNSDTMG